MECIKKKYTLPLLPHLPNASTYILVTSIHLNHRIAEDNYHGR